MNLRIRAISLAFAVMVAAALCSASSVYTYTIPSATYSTTITQSMHGFSSVNMSVAVYDANGTQITSGWSYSINSSTLEVDVSFNPEAQANWGVSIEGVWDSDTTASSDFQVMVGTAEDLHQYMSVCGPCSVSAPAVRTRFDTTYVMNSSYTIEISGHSDTFMVRAFLLNGQMVFGVSGSTSLSGITCTGQQAVCVLESGVNLYPAGAIQLGHSYYDGSALEPAVDDRPPSFQ